MNLAFVVCLVIILLLDEAYTQKLEAYILGRVLHKLGRVKVKSKDKKAVKYGVGAVAKAGKGAVQGILGKPLKLVGIGLGPLGIPLKAVGKTLEVKAVANKVKSGILAVKKLSRDSVRYG